MDEQHDWQDQLIDTALVERPVAPLPPGFVNRVTAQIQTVQVQAAAAYALRQDIRYKLELLDIAVPMLVVCLVGLGLGLTGQLAFLGIPTPLDWPAILQTSNWTFPQWLDLFGLLIFAEICLLALFCVWLWLDRPLSLANGET